MKTFWLVWNVNGGSPTYKHDSRESAKNEAERLARINPNQYFAVMESLAVVTKTDVTWLKLETDAQTYDRDLEEIPF